MSIRLLVDENISWRLKRALENPFEIISVNEISKERISDKEIWQYAQQQNLTILTFDEDFLDIQLLLGYPPKIIWLRLGNSSVVKIAGRLKSLQKNILNFLSDENSGVMEIYPVFTKTS